MKMINASEISAIMADKNFIKGLAGKGRTGKPRQNPCSYPQGPQIK
jgi:hypothetical protein